MTWRAKLAMHVEIAEMQAQLFQSMHAGIDQQHQLDPVLVARDATAATNVLATRLPGQAIVPTTMAITLRREAVIPRTTLRALFWRWLLGGRS